MMPTRGSSGASGYDLYATTETLFYDNDTVVIDTGVRIEHAREEHGNDPEYPGSTECAECGDGCIAYEGESR